MVPGHPANAHPTVAVVGKATVDYLYVMPSYPAEDSTARVLEHRTCAGGPAGRGAIAAARLGAEVRLLATCGTGPHADVMREELAQEGIAATWIVADLPSQHSAVILATDRATRTIIWLDQPPAGTRASEALPELLAGADVVLVDCTDEDLCRAAVTHANAIGVPLVLDTCSYRPYVPDLVPQCDHVIAPQKWFAAQDPGFDVHALGQWPQRPRSVLAVTQGALGGWYVLAEDPAGSGRHWPAPRVEAVDTCGAGDTFHGAYAWALAAGMDLQDRLTVAAWSAALKSTALGNDAIPSWDQVRAAQFAAGG